LLPETNPNHRENVRLSCAARQLGGRVLTNRIRAAENYQ
jgi:hypothetical protein